MMRGTDTSAEQIGFWINHWQKHHQLWCYWKTPLKLKEACKIYSHLRNWSEPHYKVIISTNPSIITEIVNWPRFLIPGGELRRRLTFLFLQRGIGIAQMYQISLIIWLFNVRLISMWTDMRCMGVCEDVLPILFVNTCNLTSSCSGLSVW